MNQISSRGISAKKVQKLIQEPGWALDTELTDSVPDDLFINAIYTDFNGRGLTIFTDGAGRLYQSKEDWLSLLKSVLALRNQEPTHILNGLLPQGQKFPHEIPSLVDELAVKLSIPVEQLDRSKESLQKIDRAIKRKGRSKCLAAGTFACLLAYVGEAIRQQVGGHWEMRATDYSDVWEPWLIDAQGRAIPIFSSVYDELYEETRCSISSVFDLWCN